MTTKRNNKGFIMVLAIIAIALVGSAMVVLTQMGSDFLLDAKQAEKRAVQRDETVSRRMLNQHPSKPSSKR